MLCGLLLLNSKCKRSVNEHECNAKAQTYLFSGQQPDAVLDEGRNVGARVQAKVQVAPRSIATHSAAYTITFIYIVRIT